MRKYSIIALIVAAIVAILTWLVIRDAKQG